MTEVDERRLRRGVFAGLSLAADDQMVELGELDHSEMYVFNSLFLAQSVVSQEDVELSGGQQEIVGLLSAVSVVGHYGQELTQMSQELSDVLRGIWRFIDGRWTPDGYR